MRGYCDPSLLLSRLRDGGEVAVAVAVVKHR